MSLLGFEPEAINISFAETRALVIIDFVVIVIIPPQGRQIFRDSLGDPRGSDYGPQI
jgi:hypothetical protein